ncbi:MBL fold metallo-hydrolase [Sphingopyxis sp.]|uniref:MBL fold metallo-hydrolase n=1 Tax=Sphingopyxis sp. TaxID=1908224 RepID=UPI001DF600A4|nr:MBL fold metallo-hydrolase [Sphingopyxis sp.]MBW8296409.1 MBL fold metallo-hydrolase [Sphingopyxis sp.]
MILRSWLAALMLGAVMLTAAPAVADDVAPSARVSSAVLVREGPSTDTAILARLRPGESATLVGDVSGWYIVELADGTRGYVSKAWTIVRADVGGEALAAVPHKVHVIDVGTGLAVFVEGPGYALLYDAGSQDDLHGGDENRVVAYIRAARPDLTRIDHLILSHPHKDHLQLMPGVFERFQVANIWESGRVNRTDGYCHFLKAAMAEPGALYHDAIASNATRSVTFSGSGCNGTVTVHQAAMMSEVPVALGPAASMHFLYRDAHPHSDPNGNSVVIRLDLGGKRVLLTGDAEGGEREPPATPPSPRSIEAKLIACCAADLQADVLVVGHHGSLTSSRTAFLDAVGASIYAISSGPYPYHRVRLPDPEIVAELAARGQVLRTDREDGFRLEDEARACEMRQRKVGPDADETPGGCDNILITIEGDRPIVAGYSALVD